MFGGSAGRDSQKEDGAVPSSCADEGDGDGIDGAFAGHSFEDGK